MIPPSSEGVEVYGAEYAKALARSKVPAAAMAFLSEERIDKLIDSLYEKGYMVAQAHERESLVEMSKAFMTNQTIVIERMDLFGRLRFLRPSEALELMLERGAAGGLPSAFMGHQFQRLVDDLYNMGIVVVVCEQEPERKWFVKWLEAKRRNPVFRLRSGPKPPEPVKAVPVPPQPATVGPSQLPPVIPPEAPPVIPPEVPYPARGG